MKLKHIQHLFHTELTHIYDSNEIDSFFFIVIEHYCKIKRIELALEPNLEISNDDYQNISDALNKLKQQKPIQYIIGETEFFGLNFKVNKNVLIPRPETEELVSWIIEEAKLQHKNNKPITILDIGTGSGCIAISLAKHLPFATIFALDINKNALETTKFNAKQNGVSITCVEVDILSSEDSVFDAESTTFDIIVSNPPYVRAQEKQQMKDNVLQYEPHLALFVADDNPLQFYNAIATFAQQNLKENGQLFFEINQYLSSEMTQLLKHFNFENIQLKKDIFGNNRMMKAIKTSCKVSKTL